MKKLAFILVMLMVTAAPTWAVNTIVYDSGQGIITFSAIDADWTWTDTVNLPGGLRVFSIRFNPGAAGDQCIIYNGSGAGTILFDSSVAQTTGGATIQYYPDNMLYKPVLIALDGTYNAAATLTIVLTE